MKYKYLRFFDKFGENLNFDYDEVNDTWSGTIYFPKTSVDLYENHHIFLLEKVEVSSNIVYSTPLLAEPTGTAKWQSSWTTRDYEKELFTYEIVDEAGVPYINRVETVALTIPTTVYTLNSEDQKVISSNVEQPLKMNIAFSTKVEDIFERTLILQDYSTTTPTLIATIKFYAESIAEDERLKVWIENFGRTFNQNDALILRDYDIKEPIADWEKVNEKRKELLLAHSDIFPYMGSYKGLVNIIRFFGYQDLRVKEYWLNINDSDANYNMYQQVELKDVLYNEYKPVLVNPLIENPSYRKTNLFGLFYDITRVTGEVNEFGIPKTENASIFTNEEVLIKLFALKEKLKAEFLPLNTKIIDIVGEGIYFERYGIRSWTDNLKTFTANVGFEVDLEAEPSTGYIRDLRAFQIMPYSTGLVLPSNRFDEDGNAIYSNDVNPYFNNQLYNPTSIDLMKESIRTYYANLLHFVFPSEGEREAYDEENILAGCPVIFKANFESVIWDDMTISWDQLDSTFTWDSIDYAHFYEVEWNIKNVGGTPYEFTVRGNINTHKELPHFLPYVGKYTVTCTLYDMYNTPSTEVKESAIEVKSKELEIAAFARFRDHEFYTWDDMDGSWDDYGCSWDRIIESDSETSNSLTSTIINWPRYANQDAEVYNTDSEAWEHILTSTFKPANQWGTNNLTWDKLEVPMDELAHVTWDLLDFHGAYLGGFKIESPTSGDTLTIGDYAPYTFTSSTLSVVAAALSTDSNEGIQLFDYHVVTPPTGPSFIHATSKQPGAIGWQFLSSTGSVVIPPYTWVYPSWMNQFPYTQFLIDNPGFNGDNLFLDAPYEDQLSGAVENRSYWEANQYLITEPDGTRRGVLPSWAGTGSFTSNDVRIFQNDFVVPFAVPVFFINNHSDIPGKNTNYWTLYNESTGETVIEIRGKPFFIYHFIKEGVYSIECTVKDSNGNESSKKRTGFIRVLNTAHYKVWRKTKDFSNLPDLFV